MVGNPPRPSSAPSPQQERQRRHVSVQRRSHVATVPRRAARPGLGQSCVSRRSTACWRSITSARPRLRGRCGKVVRRRSRRHRSRARGTAACGGAPRCGPRRPRVPASSGSASGRSCEGTSVMTTSSCTMATGREGWGARPSARPSTRDRPAGALVGRAGRYDRLVWHLVVGTTHRLHLLPPL